MQHYYIQQKRGSLLTNVPLIYLTYKSWNKIKVTFKSWCDVGIRVKDLGIGLARHKWNDSTPNLERATFKQRGMQKKKKKNQHQAIQREFEHVVSTLLKNPLGAWWDLVPIVRWVGSCFLEGCMIVSYATMFFCHATLVQHPPQLLQPYLEV